MKTRAKPATLGPAVGQFFAANLRHTKGPLAGQPFVTERWQQDDLDLIYELDDRGRRVWRTVLYGIPRGNGKSPTAAGIGLLELVDRQDAPEVFCAAGAREQANIVHRFAYGMPKDGPLVDYLEFPRSDSSAIKCPSNGGLMRILSADGDLQHGLSVSVAIIDEIHIFKTNKQEELYFALVTATQKREDSILLSITTAGANKGSLLGEKYDAILKTHDLEYSEDGCRVVARNRAAGSLMIWRGAPDTAEVTDRKMWRAVNPASWIPITELERLASEVPESVFRRLILNQWVVGHDAAIQPASWDACRVDGAIPAGADIWLGVDIGERRDTSSVVAVWPQPSGKVRIMSQVFNPDLENVKTLLPMVEAHVRGLAASYQVRGVGYDPWQFRRSGELLAADGIRMIPVPQNDSHMVPASQMVFDMVEQRQYEHDGDPILRSHVLSAEAKQTSRGTWRLAKPLQSHGRRTDDSQKVDAAIALAIATHTWAEDQNSGGEIWADTW